MFVPKLPENCLLKKTKDKISLNIFKQTLKNFGNLSVVIVDYRGSLFLSNFFTMTEIINLGITSIESLYFKRKPYENHEAIYIISCCEESLNKISEDFYKNKEKKKVPLYKSFHIFTLDEINDDFMNLILEKKEFDMIKYIKTLKQIMIKFIPIDKNIFSFGNDDNFNSLYNLYEDNETMNKINISKLVTICQCLNNYPNIAYFSPDKKCKSLAEKVNSELKKCFPKKTKKNGILLITTRLIDFTSPIQFSLIYQNVVFELLKKKNDNYYNKILLDIEKDGKKEKKEFNLDYRCEIYNKYKNMGMYDVFKKYDDDFKDFKKSDIGKLHNIKKDEKIDEVFALKNVSKYHYLSDSYSQVLNISLNLNKKMGNRHIRDLLEFHQKIISKIDNKGKKISDKEILSFLKDNIKLFGKNDIKRLLCLIKYNYPNIELNDELYEKIKKNIGEFTVSEKKVINFFNKDKCLKNKDVIEQLYQNLVSYREKNNYNTNEESENEDDKSYPYIKESNLTTLCDMCSKNKLPNSFFSFVEKAENLPKKNLKINLGALGNNQPDEEDINNTQNLILFNIGGISNYEISSLERGVEIGQIGLNLIFGGNKIYNHEEFFDEIKNYLNNDDKIIKLEEKQPKEITEAKEPKGKKDNEEQKVEINIDNEKDSRGKDSNEQLNNITNSLSDDSDKK